MPKVAPKADMNALPNGTTVKFKKWAEAGDDQPKWTARTILTVVSKESEPEEAEEGTVPASYRMVDNKGTEAQVYADELGVIMTLPEEAEEEVEEKKTTTKKAATTKTPEKKTTTKKAPAKKAATTKTIAKKTPVKTGTVVKKGSLLSQVHDKIDAGAVEQAIELSDKINSEYFILGGLIANIYETDDYAELGYSAEVVKGKKKGFEEFLQERLSVGYRKAMYLMNIYNTFEPLGEEAIERLSKIGWSQAKELARVVNEDNVTDLLDKAESMSRKQLDEYISEEYSEVKRDSEKAKMTKVNLAFHQDQGEIVQNAINEVIEREGLEDGQISEAIFAIVSEWSGLVMGNPDFTKEAAIEMIEKQFDCSLQEVDEEEIEETEEAEEEVEEE